MAKMMGPRFKLCRRLGLNVVGHPKAMERAVKGTARSDKKLSAYGIQLLEKQRLRAYYGVMEKQMRLYFKRAAKSDEPTGTALVKSLECRLDNLVYRLGFAETSRQARQMVVHGHILVNGKKVDIPSYGVAVGMEISLRVKSRERGNFKTQFERGQTPSYPYLEKMVDEYKGTLVRMPERSEIPIQINDVLVVEFYSNL